MVSLHWDFPIVWIFSEKANNLLVHTATGFKGNCYRESHVILYLKIYRSVTVGSNCLHYHKCICPGVKEVSHHQQPPGWHHCNTCHIFTQFNLVYKYISYSLSQRSRYMCRIPLVTCDLEHVFLFSVFVLVCDVKRTSKGWARHDQYRLYVDGILMVNRT